MVRACVRARVCACVRACVRACACACVRLFARSRVRSFLPSIQPARKKRLAPQSRNMNEKLQFQEDQRRRKVQDMFDNGQEKDYRE